MRKNSFILYTEYAEHLAMLDDAQAGRLFRAILAHEAGEVVELSGLEAMAFSFIKKDLERNRERYEDVSAARSEAGKKGAEKRWQKSEDSQATKSQNSKIANDSKAIISHDSKMTNANKNSDNDNDSDSDNDSDIKKENPPTGDKRKKDYATEFIEVWQAYPRKIGRADALRAYSKARKDGTSKEVILDGVKRYAAYIVKNKTEPEYIKHGSTWFNHAGWEDDYNQVVTATKKGSFYNFPQRNISEAEDLELERKLLRR